MNTFDATIDRMSVASNNDSSPTSWNVMLKDRSEVLRIWASDLVSERHIGLTKDGDVVRFVQNAKGTITGFANLTLLRRRMPTSNAVEVAVAANRFLKPEPAGPIGVRLVTNLFLLAVTALLLCGMFAITKWSMDSLRHSTDEFVSKVEASKKQAEMKGRVDLARSIIARCGTLADQSRTFLTDQRIDDNEIEVLDTRLRQIRASEGIAACPVKAPLEAPAR